LEEQKRLIEEEKESGLTLADREVLQELESWKVLKVKAVLEERLITHLKSQETRDYCLGALDHHFAQLNKT